MSVCVNLYSTVFTHARLFGVGVLVRVSAEIQVRVRVRFSTVHAYNFHKKEGVHVSLPVRVRL